ncbi:hypothetical protein [Pedobacter psychrodurus]|uniref:hypothetical protein n=1 Tax=Pedobacter psychrodurus TaxID=2530456 RepID=UPI00292F1280|nr:hypothetical protein [Pedobacter psychrodurus]
MIKIVKPIDIPEVLSTLGEEQNLLNKAAFDLDQNLYISGVDKLPILSKIYNGPDVKKILKRSQYYKCCFCEKEQADEYGDIEHFRPKEGFKVAKTTANLKPGYYWLGYTWSNLFFVCGPCNKKKSTLFPLTDENMRARSHHNNIAGESPLLLNPSGPEDPRNHIVFENEIAKGMTEQGRTTIEICDLNRSAIQEARKKLITDIQFYIDSMLSVKDPRDDIYKRALKYIKNAMTQKAQFSAAATDYITSSGVLNAKK